MRIVSLVPSLTETLWDLGVGPSVIGVTKFCVHPRDARLKAAVVGGTKDPDLVLIQGLRPDLIIADEDENKPEHIEALRAAGRRVHVTKVSTVRDAAMAVAEIGRLVGREHDAEAKSQRILERAAELKAVTSVFAPLRVFIPIWRRPLMTLDATTYMADLAAIAGAKNLFTGSPRKYFTTTFDEVRAQAPDAVLLPTEPYRFREEHRAEFAQALDLALDKVPIIDGEAFTWFGVRTLQGLDALAAAVRGLRGGSDAAPRPPENP